MPGGPYSVVVVHPSGNRKTNHDCFEGFGEIVRDLGVEPFQRRKQASSRN